MGVATIFLPNHDNWVVPFTRYVVMVPRVVWLINASCSISIFWAVPLIFMVPSVFWLQRVFHLKSTFLVSPSLSWLPVWFGSHMFFTQNQHFWPFSSLLMVPIVIRFLGAFCS